MYKTIIFSRITLGFVGIFSQTGNCFYLLAIFFYNNDAPRLPGQASPFRIENASNRIESWSQLLLPWSCWRIESSRALHLPEQTAGRTS